MWIKPIYNRTNVDVINALEVLSRWREEIRQGKNVTLEYLKGCLNAVDLQRIESNMRYLINRLRAVGYSLIVNDYIPDWSPEKAPTQIDIDKLLTNLKELHARIVKFYGIEPPNNLLGYSGINAIEKIQELIYEYIPKIFENIKYTNTFYSGEENIL